MDYSCPEGESEAVKVAPDILNSKMTPQRTAVIVPVIAASIVVVAIIAGAVAYFMFAA